MTRERMCLDGVRIGSFVVVRETAARGRQRAFLLCCGRCGHEKVMTYSDLRRAQRATRALVCRECGRREPEVLSFDYRTDSGLLIQEFLCGRFRATRSGSP